MEEDLEEDSVLQENKKEFEVLVKFIVQASDLDDAESELISLIQEGILTILDNEDKEVICDYDVVSTELAKY